MISNELLQQFPLLTFEVVVLKKKEKKVPAASKYFFFVKIFFNEKLFLGKSLHRD